jgi:RNA polymerase subunit RPABC4/transcription elongation factor Spt4
MKFCYQCGRMTPGEPLFCSSCGRSYDVKLCPRLHASSRSAEVCSQCGSRELSIPQPRVSVWWRVLEFLAKVFFGVFLVYLTLAGFVALLKTPQFQNALIVFGILIGLLWWLWSLLPEWFRKLVRRSITRKEGSHER